jgi:hypothetical protein
MTVSGMSLEQASLIATGRQLELRSLYANILLFNCPTNPWELWLAHQDHMCEDILHAKRLELGLPTLALTEGITHEAHGLTGFTTNLATQRQRFQGFPTHALACTTPTPRSCVQDVG